MSALFESTVADRIRMQNRAVKLLADIWQKGAKAKLEPLMWQVGASGIAGMATCIDPVEREAAIRAWAKLLNVELTERATGDGWRRLLYQPGDYSLPAFALKADIEPMDQSPEMSVS